MVTAQPAAPGTPLGPDELLNLLEDEADRWGPGGVGVADWLARLEAMDPGWWPLAELADIDPRGLSPDEALSYLRVVTAHQAWLESLANQALVAAAGPVRTSVSVLGHDDQPPVPIDDVVREEVAAALRLAPVTAHGRIEAARTIQRHLPATAEALSRGRITGLQAKVVADAVRQVAPERAADFARGLEGRVLPRAMRGTVGELRSSVRVATRRLDPGGVAERARLARQGLDVQVWHDHAGVSTLSARLLTEQAMAVAAAIEGVARDPAFGIDPAATAGQRRSEALVALVMRPLDGGGGPGAEATAAGSGSTTGADTPGNADGPVDPLVGALARLRTAPSPGGPPARASLQAGVVLVMDVPTWLGLRDDPVAILGGGDLPAEVARELAADAQFRRAIVDPVTGHLLDYGRRSYAVPEPLRRYLLMRDQVCRFPGCARGSEGCEADHAVAWNEGGSTSAANLGMLCQRHHQLKTHAGWRLQRDNPDGSSVWTSPQGRTYVVDPPVLIAPEGTDPPGSAVGSL